MYGAKKNWKAFYEGIPDDEPNAWCLNLLSRFKAEEIILVSGRPSNYREQTEKWLHKHGIRYVQLFMRREHDFRPDFEVKTEIYRHHIEPEYEILFCVDDRKQVVDAWRKLGLTCLQCAEGNF